MPLPLGRDEADCQAEFVAAMLPHAEILLRTALRFSHGEPTAAEDAVQDTFLSAWRAFHQFERGTNARAWLFRILMNLLHKRWQRGQRHPEPIFLDDHLAGGHEVAAPCPGTTDPVDSDVSAALDTLPADQRAVLVLNVVEGFTCQDIAAMLDVPIGTVMSRLGRGRLALRQLLQPPTAVITDTRS